MPLKRKRSKQSGRGSAKKRRVAPKRGTAWRSFKSVVPKRTYGKLAGYRTFRPKLNNGSGITNSYVTHSNKPMKHVSVKSAHQDLYKARTTFALAVPTGRTDFQPVNVSGDVASWLAAYGQAVDVTASYRDMNLVPANGSFTNRKFWVDYHTIETEFTNMGPATVKMEIYVCLAKTDRTQRCRQAAIEGLFDESGIITNEEVVTNVGACPADSRMFRSFWKVLRKQVVYLGTGRHHRHVTRRNINGFLPFDKMKELENLSGQGCQVRGYTIETMLKITGMPADNANTVNDITGLPATGLISTQGAKVACITTECIKSRIVDTKSRHIAYPALLPQPTNMYGQNMDGQGGFDVVQNNLNLFAMQ